MMIVEPAPPFPVRSLPGTPYYLRLMELILGALALGLAYAFLGMGIFITMRVFNFPDITADGSLTLGGAITAALLTAGADPWLTALAAMAGGFIAGMLTGTLYTKFRINGLLSGILVMTALYSVNLRVMGRSNVPLINVRTVLTPFEGLLGGGSASLLPIALFLLLTILFLALLSWLFRTDFGLAMRATGDNETMIAAQGASTDAIKIIGIGLSNALIALSGSLVAQYQGFADIGMGIGIIVFGLASVIIGDTLAGLFGDRFRIAVKLTCVVVGSILFRALVAGALSLGLNPTDLKLVTALFVFLTILLPRFGRRAGNGGRGRAWSGGRG
jgi:putative ABC transport system permease protein